MMTFSLALFFSLLAFALFWFFHRQQHPLLAKVEITVAHLPPDRGLLHYREEIEKFLISLRYEKIALAPQSWRFNPRTRMSLSQTFLLMEWDAYSITLQGPRNLLKILLSATNLQKIFLSAGPPRFPL